MKNMLLILSVLINSDLVCQKVIDVEKNDYKVTSSQFYAVGGEPVSSTKYVRVVRGTPYFRDFFIKGKVIMMAGNVYDSILLRLDLRDNTLQYIDPGGKEMIVTSPAVRSVIFYDSASGKIYEFDHSAFWQATNKIEKGWYQLIADGQAALYKRLIKVINENQPYGSATMEQTIIDITEYYIFVNSVFTHIKKFKAITELLNDKKDMLNKYISINRLTGRSDSDYIALIDYYNNLLAK